MDFEPSHEFDNQNTPPVDAVARSEKSMGVDISPVYAMQKLKNKLVEDDCFMAEAQDGSFSTSTLGLCVGDQVQSQSTAARTDTKGMFV